MTKNSRHFKHQASLLFDDWQVNRWYILKCQIEILPNLINSVLFVGISSTVRNSNKIQMSLQPFVQLSFWIPWWVCPRHTWMVTWPWGEVTWHLNDGHVTRGQVTWPGPIFTHRFWGGYSVVEVRFSASFMEPRYIRKTPIFTVGIESLSQFKPVPICTFANTVSLLTILQSNQVISWEICHRQEINFRYKW